MNSFSIAAYDNQPVLDTYKKWLEKDVYSNFCSANINDPNFMQKLSFLQAEGIRHDIGLHAAVTHGSIQSAGMRIGAKIQDAANLITSSLDDGFTLMNNRMLEVNNNLQGIGLGIGEVNQKLRQNNQILSHIGREVSQINRGVGSIVSGVDALNTNFILGIDILSKNIAQSAGMIVHQLQQNENTLCDILDELRIPESQRERRYHIQEGIKYFNKGMSSGDCLYFDDALDEFTTATSIEKKDFFSWYYIGMIYLYSKDHINLEKSLSSFDRYTHYAEALTNKHYLYDDSCLMKAECKYLMGDSDSAYKMIETLIAHNVKASLRAMKYLSASMDNSKQQKAVDILKQLMKDNPYIVMQILEDYDLLSNGYIKEYIISYRNDTVKEFAQLIGSCDKAMESLELYPISDYQDVLNELLSIKSRIRNESDKIAIVDAIYLKKSLEEFPNKVVSALQKAASLAAERNRQEKIKAEQARREQLRTVGYIDLGLPSGTLWKDKNEPGGWRHKKLSPFRSWVSDGNGGHLPSVEQLTELKDRCRWTWVGNGYQVTGPNGNKIIYNQKIKKSTFLN